MDLKDLAENYPVLLAPLSAWLLRERAALKQRNRELSKRLCRQNETHTADLRQITAKLLDNAGNAHVNTPDPSLTQRPRQDNDDG